MVEKKGPFQLIANIIMILLALCCLFPFLLLSVTMPGGFGISGMLIMHAVMIAVCAAILFAGHRMKIWGPRQF